MLTARPGCQLPLSARSETYCNILSAKNVAVGVTARVVGTAGPVSLRPRHGDDTGLAHAGERVSDLPLGEGDPGGQFGDLSWGSAAFQPTVTKRHSRVTIARQKCQCVALH